MNDKIKEMIAIGASIGAHCQPCLTYHATKAKEVGLTDDEIREAIAVGHMVEKGAMAAMRDFTKGILDGPAKADAGCCGESKSKGCCA
ncbi:MAG: carboxymuconolactone decarboxylase family protein [Kiritimatiellia bacterium]